MLFLVAIYGRLYTLYMIADLLKLFGITSISESIYEQKISQLDEFMKARNLPPSVRAKVIHYYNYKTQKEYFNEQAVSIVIPTLKCN
nr:unnamed protein product [Callosobruchus analis]